MSTQTTDPFMTGGGPAITFKTIGDKASIIVRKVTEKVDTDPVNNEIKRWPNNDPKMVFLFEGEDEQGEPISLWVRGNMVKTIREATAKAGLKSVIDTKVTVKFDSEGEPPKKGLNPPKLYKAVVEKVAAAVVDDRFSQQEEPF